MARPLRLEFPGALYHVTSRGDQCASIYADDFDREEWQRIVCLVCTRFNFQVHAYCQMGNHFHIMLETVDANLCQGMRQLNSLYAQYFNRRHRRVGHVFQGRYKAILVQKEGYLLELARYIALNPVRAGLVALASDWRWSNHNATIGTVTAPPWLTTDWLLRQFGDCNEKAREAYQSFVAEGINKSSPLLETRHQLVLGDEAFVAQYADRTGVVDLTAVCKEQRRLTALSLQDYAEKYTDRNEAMARAYSSTAFTMRQIGHHFGVSYKTVGRVVKLYEDRSLDLRNSTNCIEEIVSTFRH